MPLLVVVSFAMTLQFFLHLFEHFCSTRFLSRSLFCSFCLPLLLGYWTGWLTPLLIPACVLAIPLFWDTGHPQLARRDIQIAWPHPWKRSTVSSEYRPPRFCCFGFACICSWKLPAPFLLRYVMSLRLPSALFSSAVCRHAGRRVGGGTVVGGPQRQPD